MRKTTPLSALALAAALACGSVAAKSPAEWQELTTRAKVSLVQAIEHATRAVPGKVIDAELGDSKHNGLRYDVEVITPAGERVEVWVDAMTGQASQHKNEGPAKRKDMERLQDAKATIHQAIQSATAHTPGTPVNAELDAHWGKTSYQVDVIQADGALMEVKVDAADGKVIRSKRD